MDNPEFVRAAEITEIPEYEVRLPIKVFIYKQEGRFQAQAISLGSEIDGWGFTENEALDDLKKLLVSMEPSNFFVNEAIRKK